MNVLNKKKHNLFFSSVYFLIITIYFTVGLNLFGVYDASISDANAAGSPTMTGFTATPVGDGNFTFQATVDEVSDLTLYASFRYASGSCGSFAGQPTTTLSTATGTYSSSYGSFTINNSQGQGAQVTNIPTNAGANTISVRWLATTQLPGATGTYCIYAFSGNGGTNSTILSTTVTLGDPVTPTLTSLTVTPDGDGNATLQATVDDSSSANFTLYSSFRYAAGACGSYAGQPTTTLDTATSTYSSSFGTITIDNNQSQGAHVGSISTASGANTISVKWLANTQLSGAVGQYCIYAFSGYSGTNSSISNTTVTLSIQQAAPEFSTYVYIMTLLGAMWILYRQLKKNDNLRMSV